MLRYAVFFPFPDTFPHIFLFCFSYSTVTTFAKFLGLSTSNPLRGGLGMGKTAFTRGLARGLGCTGRVTSPTFTIVNEYDGTTPLFHFDMYRLDSEDDLFDIGWDDYLARGGVCAVEWSERIDSALPPDALTVSIARGENDNDRIITVTGGPAL